MGNCIENVLSEYLSSVIAEANKDDPEYMKICERMDGILGASEAVRSAFDKDEAVAISKEDCKTLIEYIRLDSKRTMMDIETIYFRGHRDCINYLKGIKLF